MKKIIVILFILLVMIGSTGCNNKEDEKNLFIEKVKTFEMNEIKFATSEITYDEYKENISGIFTQNLEKYYLEKKDSKVPDGLKSVMTGTVITTEEELKGDIKSNQENTGKIELTIEISDENYEGTFEGEKRIYSKTTQVINIPDVQPAQFLIFKMYDFKKTNDKWRISQIKNSFVRVSSHYDRETETMIELTGEKLKEVLKHRAFTPENNSKIEYVESINLILLSQ